MGRFRRAQWRLRNATKKFSYESLNARSQNPFGSRVFHHSTQPVHQGLVDDGGTPARVRWTDRGPHYFFLLVARERPSGGLSGAGRTPSRSDNACPARAFPVPRQKGVNPARSGGPHPRAGAKPNINAK